MIGKGIVQLMDTMFFKKKKTMEGNTTNGNENTDNLAQNEEFDQETMAEAVDNGGNEVNKEIEKLKADIEELRDKQLRQLAEFDNYRRRTAKEKLDLEKTAARDTIQSLLVVMDDMDRASKQLNNTTDVTLLKEGVSLVFNKLRNIMQQKGLKAMDADGKEFDPDLHEAITEIPAPNPKMVGKIMDVVEPGYYLNDKLIRHAKVVVGK
jgi:molecular chaperone GrpE